MHKPPADPKAPWRVVLAVDQSRDPAINDDASDQGAIVEYLISRDPTLIGTEIKLHDGIAPTWWTLAPLSFAFVTELLARETSPERQRVIAARAALVRAEGPSADGINLDVREGALGGMTLLAPAEAERIYNAVGYQGVLELGDIALVRARLRPGMRGPFGLCRS